MKKSILFLIVMVFGILLISGVSASADDFQIKKIFFGKGTFQRFVGFDFIVPQTDCQNLLVYKYEPGFWGQPGQWALKKPGQPVKRGLYRFVNFEVECSRKFIIEGTTNEIEEIETWQVLEVEPEDVGLLVRNSWIPNNYFNLPTNDRVASFYILMPNPGMNSSLRTIARHEDFIYMIGDLRAVIVSDSAGFLKRYIKGKSLSSQLDMLWVRDDDVVILEYRNEYK